jgi:hypothetical protein
MFIWNVREVLNGDPLLYAAECQRQGFAWVALKVTNGVANFGGDLSRFVIILQSVGVRVWGWGYIYGSAENNNPVVEADVAADRVLALRLDGWIINAEHEYRPPPADTQAILQARRDAAAYANRLRVRLGDAMGMALCSYRYPRLHPTLPWKQFLERCTFHLPQVYWIGTRTPGEPSSQLAKSVVQLKEQWDLPVVPAGVACRHPYSGGMWEPTVAQLDNFYQGVKASGLIAWTWWAWEHTIRRAEWWQAVRLHGSN